MSYGCARTSGILIMVFPNARTLRFYDRIPHLLPGRRVTAPKTEAVSRGAEWCGARDGRALQKHNTMSKARCAQHRGLHPRLGEAKVRRAMNLERAPVSINRLRQERTVGKSNLL